MAAYVEWAPRIAPSPPVAPDIDFALVGKCTYLEMLHYPDIPHVVQNQGDLLDESLSEWLSKDLSQLISPMESGLSGISTSRVTPSGGLRLLFGVCGYDPEKNLEQIYGKSTVVVPFTKENFSALEDKLGLPKNFLRIFSGKIGHRSFKNSRKVDNGYISCYTFKFTGDRPSSYQLALSYDHQTRLTHGLLLAKSCSHEFRRLVRSLEDRVDNCEQPLLLAALIAELMIDRCTERVNTIHGELNNLEDSMGQHQYRSRPRGNPLEVDFEKTTSKITLQSRRLPLDTARLQGVLLALELIRDETEKIVTQTSLHPASSGTTKSHIAAFDGSFIIEEMVSGLVNACKNTLLRVEFETKRAQTLETPVYQFMAQKDAKVNIELAKTLTFLAKASKEDSEAMRVIAVESRKDTSSMKTIAVLTMLFLPGTFLAAIFALPFFDWDSDGSPAVKAEFKYYWAITLPLTFLVLILWTLATILPWRKWLPKNESHSTQPELEFRLKSSTS